MKNDWSIRDSGGVIHTGTEEEMRLAFRVMINRKEDYQKQYGGSDKDIEQIYESWNAEWNDDLELVQTHEIYR